MLFFHSDIFNSLNLFLHHKHLSLNGIGDGVMFTCSGVSFAFIWSKNSIFMFDSHSRDNEGCSFPNGQAVFLEFRSAKVLNFFLIKYFKNSIANMWPLRYDIQYIEIVVSGIEVGNILACLRHQRQVPLDKAL